MDLPAITNLQSEWQRASRSKRAGVLYEQLLELEPDLAMSGAASWSELLDSPAPSGGDNPVESWKVTAALLRQFHRDHLIGLALLVRLIPGLLTVARSLDWGRTPPWQDAETLATDVVSTAWEMLSRNAGRTIAYPERSILRAVRRRLERQRAECRRRSAREEPIGVRANDIRDRNPIPVLDELAMALRLRQPQLPLEDVQLVFRHRVLGLSFRELAKVSGTSVCMLEQRSYRVEASLCA